jgi:hypothetical protein
MVAGQMGLFRKNLRYRHPGRIRLPHNCHLFSADQRRRLTDVITSAPVDLVIIGPGILHPLNASFCIF